MVNKTFSILGLFKNSGDEDTSWMQHGACRGMNPELFFPGPGDSHTEALAVCNSCPVSEECLDYRIATTPGTGSYLDDGIWGGTNSRERVRLRRLSSSLHNMQESRC